MPCLKEKDDMKSRFTQRALPPQENDGYATNAFTYFAKSSVLSRRRDRQKKKHWGSSAGTAVTVAIGTSLMLPWSLVALLVTLSVAAARDFSSQTVNPRGSYSGVRMQQGHPQLDNDRKPDFRGSSVKLEAGRGSIDMQQGKISRDNDWIDAEKRGKNSNIFCGTNCRQ
jgi:hypothetical protein